MSRPWRQLRRPPAARLIQVVEVSLSEGEGTDEEPVRMVRYYYLPDGTLLSRGDTHEDETRQEAES